MTTAANRMSPSFSAKCDVRYRFYVSSALLTGRKQEVGTLPRISAPDLEAAVVTAVKERNGLPPSQTASTGREMVCSLIERVEVSQNVIRLALKNPHNGVGPCFDGDAMEPAATAQSPTGDQIEIPWRQNSKGPLARIEQNTTNNNEPDPALIHAVARAHSWTKMLMDGEHASIESLAASVQMHPKVVRKHIRLAFMAPEITEAIVLGRNPKALTLARLQQATALSWAEQRRKL